MKSIWALLFLLLLPSTAWAACSGQSLTLQTVNGNVVVCVGGGSGGPYWFQHQIVDTNNIGLDSAAGTSNPGGRAIAIQGITNGVPLPASVSTLPLPSNAAQETGGNIALSYAAIGPIGSSAASADTGSFNLNSMIQRLNQHLTTINTTLGSPFQAGGTVVANGGGTAGTPNSGVMSVQGISSMTPFLDNPGTASNWGIQSQGSTTSGEIGNLIQGAVTTNAPSYTTGQTSPLSLDTSGSLRVNVTSAPSSPNTNLVQVGSNNVSTAANGTQLVGIEGHAASTLDFGIGGAAAPTNALAIGGQYNSSPLTLSSGNAAALQLDTNGYTLISPTNITIAQASTTSGQTGSLVMGAASTSTPSYTNAKTYPISLDGSGNLRVNCATGCSTLTLFADESAFTAGTTAVNLSAGFYQTTPTSNPLSTGQGGSVQLTKYRAIMDTPFDSAGNDMTDTTNHALKVEGTNASSSVNVICTSGCAGSGGTAATDEATYTQGTSSLTPIGGFYSTSITNLSNNQTGAVQMTNDRMIYTNLGKVGGAAFALGQTTMSGSLPVAIASNQSNVPTNTAQVNGVTVLTGAGAVGTGSQRVAVGQDTTTIAGSAPGTAASPSANVVTIQGVGSMTPVAVSANTTANASGNPLYVTPASGANFAGANPMQTTGGTVGLVAGSANIGKIDILGNAGGTLDTSPGTSASTAFTVQGSASGVAIPVNCTSGCSSSTNVTQWGSNNVLTGGSNGSVGVGGLAASSAAAVGNPVMAGAVYNSSFPTPSSGNVVDLQADSSGRLITNNATGMSGTVPSTAPSFTDIVGGIYNSSAPTPTPGQTLPFQTDSSGNLKTNVTNTVSSNTAQVNGTTTLTGVGAIGAGAQRVGVAQDTTTIAGSAPGTVSAPSSNVISAGAPPRGSRNFPGCTVGATSGQCLASSTAITFVQIQNTSLTANIACAWGATAVLNSSGSFQLGPGQGASWGLLTGGVPTGALNCIASAASTPAYLEWN